MLWLNLNEDNKVSLFVRYIEIASGKSFDNGSRILITGCFVKGGQAIGIGAGQQSRVHCTDAAVSHPVFLSSCE